jgi:tetratricopeptide (TPR) repeat protein
MARPPRSESKVADPAPVPSPPLAKNQTISSPGDGPPPPGSFTMDLADEAAAEKRVVEDARWRVEKKLFEGEEEVTQIGRYQVTGPPIGSGGMGVIYPGFDPVLNRRVAIKMLHAPGRDGTNAVEEGRALAKLKHVNVVPIYDCDREEDKVFILMELVDGETLRSWTKIADRTTEEILGAYQQAGRGLAAAHAEKLVHRDFKPDNAIMGTDGVVRVVDFGLACEAADPTAVISGRQRVAGTPRYMAPEQAIGQPVTPTADQYSFCVALAEALGEAKPEGRALPRWLQKAVARGRDPIPSDRFGSMNDLLAVLSHDRTVVRRWWAAAGVLAVAGTVAFFAGRTTHAPAYAACGEGAARLSSVWGPEGQAAALDRIGTLSTYGRSLRPRLEEQLRDHAQRWTGGYRDACLAHARGVQSDGLLDRRMACLEQGRAALKSVAEIIRTADAQSVPSITRATTELPTPDSCNDVAALLAGVEPPPAQIATLVGQLRGRLEEARILIAAGRAKPARELAGQAAKEARQLAYTPALAESLLVEGHALMTMDDRPAAIPVLTEAFTLAFQAGLHSLAVEAWARRAWSQGTTVGGEGALAGVEIVEAVAANKGTSQFARALLLNNIGSVELALEHRDRARAAFERAAREAQDVVGPGAAELLWIRSNLAVATDDRARRDALLAEYEENTAKLLGDDHPDTLWARWNRGMMLASFADAIKLLVPTCASLEAQNPERAISCWSEVGFAHGERGDHAGALAAVERASSIQVGDHPRSPAALAYVHFWRGDTPGAAHAFAAALDALPTDAHEPWWTRFERAELELGLGRAERLSGHAREARRALVASIEALTDIVEKHPGGTFERRLGRARVEMVKLLAAVHAPRAEIARHAAPALVWLREAGGLEAEIAEIDRLSLRDGAKH